MGRGKVYAQARRTGTAMKLFAYFWSITKLKRRCFRRPLTDDGVHEIGGLPERVVLPRRRPRHNRRCARAAIPLLLGGPGGRDRPDAL